MRPDAESGTEAVPVRPSAPLFIHETKDCVFCFACVRHCPARAIRIVDGHVEVLEDRCIQCGLCVKECGNGGHTVRDDLPLVEAMLASRRPVVALLASESVAAMHPLTQSQVESRLVARGFAGMETTVLGEELIAFTYEKSHTPSAQHLPRLRSTCPVAVSWVCRFHPAFTEALVPVVPPYVAQARLIRALYPQDVAIVYVSPCWARKDDIFEPEIAGAVDVAIGFDELRRLLELGGESRPDDDEPVAARPRVARQLSAIDGFPRRTLIERNLTDGDVAVVRGLDEIDRLLAAIVRGETAPAVVDMLNCEGCIDGPCVNRGLSVFMKRAIDVAERECQPPSAVDSRAFLATLPNIDLTRRFSSRSTPARIPTDEEIDVVLAAGEFESREAAIDCGMCGYRTCVAHAAAICEGSSTWEMCFPLQRRLLERERAYHADTAAIDDLTGLLNRRAFEYRIAEEVARAQRYDVALSLAVLDLDEFGKLNELLGRACGDEVLRSVGALLGSQLRTADAAVRYGGDEFVLILPSTTKTDAWAVAEKVRSSIARLTIRSQDESWASPTVSIGIASFSATFAQPQALVDAARRAVAKAKRNGRNRVEIAGG